MQFVTSTVDAGLKGVNGAVQVSMPRDRWILSLGGPRMGPAVLFWGVVLALALIAFALGRLTITPLKWYQWFLLALGLTQAPLIMGVVVVGWLLVLGARRAYGDQYTRNWVFNFGQIILALWTVAALVSMWMSISVSAAALRLSGAGTAPAMAVVAGGVAGTWMILVFRRGPSKAADGHAFPLRSRQ